MAGTKKKPSKTKPSATEQRGKFATVKQACEFLGVPRRTLFRWREKGLVPSVTISGSVKIAWEALDEIARRAGATTAR